MHRAIAVLLGLLLTAPAMAQSRHGPQPLPHYASQRPAKAFMREGPSYNHKVIWEYRHRGYPFLVTARFDVWRRVRAMDGTVGWMNAHMLTDARTVLVTGKGRVQIHESGDPKSKVIGLADPNAILGLKACEAAACRVYADGVDGWVSKGRIWGVNANEVFN